MVPHSISWVPDFRAKFWLPRTFGNLVYLHQIVGGDSHQLYTTEYATFIQYMNQKLKFILAFGLCR